MQPMPSPEEMPYVDLPELREIFATHSRMTHFDGHSVHVTLAIARAHPTGPDAAGHTLLPAARLVLSPFAAVVLHEQLTAMIPLIEKQGLVRRMAPSTKNPQ